MKKLLIITKYSYQALYGGSEKIILLPIHQVMKNGLLGEQVDLVLMPEDVTDKEKKLCEEMLKPMMTNSKSGIVYY